MSYIEELQAILSRYPEIKRIKVEIPELILEREVKIITQPQRVIIPKVEEIMEVTETKTITEPVKKKEYTPPDNRDQAIKATLASLTIPKL